MIRKVTILSVLFLSALINGQISGRVLDRSTQEPLPYLNIWVKNTMVGATTSEDGHFLLANTVEGDTILISRLGYKSIEFLAKEKNQIYMDPMVQTLEEVEVLPMYNNDQLQINSYEKVSKRRDWYNNGHYSLARFYEYKDVYKTTPFIDKISFVTNNAKKDKVILTVRLLGARGGEPSEMGLTDIFYLHSSTGVTEVSLDLREEKVRFPKEGFFVVVDRLNLKSNKSFNKISNMDILQPAIGIERTEQEKNTWFGFGERWIAPSNMKGFVGTNQNIAVNITLTN